VRNGCSKPQEVASEIDSDPLSGVGVRHCIPTGRIDAGRERTAVKERPRLLASERSCGWVESEHDASGEQLGGYEADRGVKR